MKTKVLAGTACSLTLFAMAQPALALTWFDFTSVNATTALGNAGGVNVTVTGTLNTTYSQTAGGVDYWAFPAYAGFTPTNTDVIALGIADSIIPVGDLKTISFSTPVQNVYLALTSWNAPPIVTLPGGDTTFSAPFLTLVGGVGYFLPSPGFGSSAPGGSGTNVLPGTFDEVNGIVQFVGNFSSITFVDTNENYHGFTVGYDSIANIPVPEASTWLMMMAGFGVLGSALRRRRPEHQVRVRFQ